MIAIRYWIFKKISAIGWHICPEPHRSFLHRGIGTWEEVYERMNIGARP